MEAIEHLEDSFKNKEFPCESCKDEHKQLLEWLKELKTFKESCKCLQIEKDQKTTNLNK